MYVLVNTRYSVQQHPWCVAAADTNEAQRNLN